MGCIAYRSRQFLLPFTSVHCQIKDISREKRRFPAFPCSPFWCLRLRHWPLDTCSAHSGTLGFNLRPHLGAMPFRKLTATDLLRLRDYGFTSAIWRLLLVAVYFLATFLAILFRFAHFRLHSALLKQVLHCSHWHENFPPPQHWWQKHWYHASTHHSFLLCKVMATFRLQGQVCPPCSSDFLQAKNTAITLAAVLLLLANLIARKIKGALAPMFNHQILKNHGKESF